MESHGGNGGSDIRGARCDRYRQTEITLGAACHVEIDTLSHVTPRDATHCPRGSRSERVICRVMSLSASRACDIGCDTVARESDTR